MKAEEKFWYRWIWNYSLGELFGIGAAAIIGRLLFVEFSNLLAQTPSVVTIFMLIIAGAAEGSIIGFIQWKSLSKLLPDLGKLRWILMTTTSTVVGWLLVLPPAVLFISFLSKFSLLNNYYSIFYTSLSGLAFGTLIGIPQFFLLKKYYSNALLWTLANAFAWMISFLIVYTAFSLFNYATFFFYNFILIILACVLSGFVQGVVTGLSLHFVLSVKSTYKRVYS